MFVYEWLNRALLPMDCAFANQRGGVFSDLAGDRSSLKINGNHEKRMLDSNQSICIRSMF
jgi:hypothetical protein